MATNKVKDAFHEAANVLKRAFAHLETESAGSMLPPGVMKLMKSLRRLLSRYIEGPCLSYFGKPLDLSNLAWTYLEVSLMQLSMRLYRS